MNYRYCSSLSGYIMLNCAKTLCQFWHGDVHLFIICSVAKNKAFLKESSVGKEVLTFVNFLSCLLKPSSVFVLYTIFLIFGGKSKYVDKFPQLLVQFCITIGYLVPQIDSRDSKVFVATCSLVACYTNLRSFIKALLSFEAIYFMEFLI